jgi:hypothetical protein
MITLGGGAAQAEDFTATSMAPEMPQSRNFENTTAQELLRACLAVIQDIKFHVTETGVTPGLIVAEFPGVGGQHFGDTLTISLKQLPGAQNGFQVRLSVAAQNLISNYSNPQNPAYSDFYQDFFAHLNRELFKERLL